MKGTNIGLEGFTAELAAKGTGGNATPRNQRQREKSRRPEKAYSLRPQGL